MDALVKNWKPIDSWAGDRPSRVAALAPDAIEIDAGAADVAARISSMEDGLLYLMVNLPNWIDMREGVDLREFDPATWQLLPLQWRVDHGYEVLDPRLKVSGEKKMLKSERELMRDKIIPTPPGWKLIEDVEAEDGLGLVQMTDAELIASGVVSLHTWKEGRCKAVEVERDRRLETGYACQGHPIKTDKTSMDIAHSFLSAILAGACTFPVEWKCADNEYIYFNDADEFKPFALGMLPFGQAIYKASWDAKDAIRACETYEAALAAFSAYVEA